MNATVHGCVHAFGVSWDKHSYTQLRQLTRAQQGPANNLLNSKKLQHGLSSWVEHLSWRREGIVWGGWRHRGWLKQHCKVPSWWLLGSIRLAISSRTRWDECLRECCLWMKSETEQDHRKTNLYNNSTTTYKKGLKNMYYNTCEIPSVTGQQQRKKTEQNSINTANVHHYCLQSWCEADSTCMNHKTHAQVVWCIASTMRLNCNAICQARNILTQNTAILSSKHTSCHS